MTYPPAPWRLKGQAIIHFQLADISQARRCVSEDVQILPVLPGNTLSLLYMASYGHSSDVEYNELLVVPALVWKRRRPGAYVSHAYVDDATSRAGGREIWDIPKEMADFEWERGDSNCVTVRRDGKRLCRLSTTQPAWHMPLPLVLPVFGALRGEARWFHAKGSARVGFARTHLDVPMESPLTGLHSGPGLAAHCHRLKLSIEPPEPGRSLGKTQGE